MLSQPLVRDWSLITGRVGVGTNGRRANEVSPLQKKRGGKNKSRAVSTRELKALAILNGGRGPTSFHY